MLLWFQLSDSGLSIRVVDVLTYHVSNETCLFFSDDIVASFRLQKTVPELEGNTSKLELDIYAEIGIPNSIVCPHTSFILLPDMFFHMLWLMLEFVHRWL